MLTYFGNRRGRLWWIAHASLRSRRFVDLLGRARRRQPSYHSFKDPTDANPRVRILGAAAAEPGDPIRAGDAPRVLSITGSATVSTTAAVPARATRSSAVVVVACMVLILGAFAALCYRPP